MRSLLPLAPFAVAAACGPIPQLVLEDDVSAVAVRTPSGWSTLQLLDQGRLTDLEPGSLVLAYRDDELQALPGWQALTAVPLRAAEGCEPRLPQPQAAYAFDGGGFASVDASAIDLPTHPDLAACRDLAEGAQLFATCDRSSGLSLERVGIDCEVQIRGPSTRSYRARLHQGGGCIETRAREDADWRACIPRTGTAGAWATADCPVPSFAGPTSACPVEVRPRRSFPSEPQVLSVVPGGPRQEGPDLNGLSLLRAPFLRTGQIHSALAHDDGLWVTARERLGKDVHCGMPGRGLPAASRWLKLVPGSQGPLIESVVAVDPCAAFLHLPPEGSAPGSVGAFRPLGPPSDDGLQLERVVYGPDGTRTASTAYRLQDFGPDSEIVAVLVLQPECGPDAFVLVHDPFDAPRRVRATWLWDDGRSDAVPAFEDRLSTTTRQTWLRLAVGAVHRLDGRRLWLGMGRSTRGDAAEALIAEVDVCDGSIQILSAFNVNETDNIRTTLDFTSLYPSDEEVGFTTVFPLRAWGRTRGRDGLPDLTFHYAPFQIGPSANWSPGRRIASVFQTGDDVGRDALEVLATQVDLFDTSRFYFEYTVWQPSDPYGAPTAWVQGRDEVWGIAGWTGQVVRFPRPELP